MVGVFEKLGQFYNGCLEFKEKPVNFTPGKWILNPSIDTATVEAIFHLKEIRVTDKCSVVTGNNAKASLRPC